MSVQPTKVITSRVRPEGQLLGPAFSRGQEVLIGLGLLLVVGGIVAYSAAPKEHRAWAQVSDGVFYGGYAAIGAPVLWMAGRHCYWHARHYRLPGAEVPSGLKSASGANRPLELEPNHSCCLGVTRNLIEVCLANPAMTGQQLVGQLTADRIQAFQAEEVRRARQQRPSEPIGTVLASGATVAMELDQEGLYLVQGWTNQLLGSVKSHAVFVRLQPGHYGFCDMNGRYYDGFADQASCVAGLEQWLRTQYPAFFGSRTGWYFERFPIRS